MTGDAPKISVVLATYNRADTLRRTLEHLAKQDLSPQDYEVIVVDDGSTDQTGQVVRQAQGHAAHDLRYLRHGNRGPGYTQNRGLRDARAPIALFIADDIFLTPGALRAHLRAHELNPEPGIAVLGKVLQSPELTQSVFLRRWDPFRFNELEDLTELRPYRFGAANLSVKRDFLLEKGMFLEHRGRAGAAAMEDLELGYRLRKHGMRLLYAKDALGYHYHYTTLDNAILRWYERGLNYGEFRSHAPDPELTVYFHVLTLRNLNEYRRGLREPGAFRGLERILAWHVVRHLGRMITLNRLTARWLWRPLFAGAESSSLLASLVTAKMYRAFLYYHFLRGVAEGRQLYGD